MSNLYPSEFTVEIDNKVKFVPTMIKTLHGLAKFILRMYMESQLYTYNQKSRIQFMKDVIKSQDEDCYTLETCVAPLSVAIVSNYNIYKKKGTLPLCNRDKKQLAFLVRKILESTDDN